MSYPNHVRKDGYVDVNTSVTIFMFQCFIGCVVQNFATFGSLSMWLHLSGYNRGWVQQSSSPELA